MRFAGDCKRQTMISREPLHLAALVSTGEIYQVEMTADFKPYRVNVNYLHCE